MIFDQFIPKRDPIMESLDMNSIEDIYGDPFEYMIGAAYECSFIEKNINLYALAEEYNYLRETGEAEFITEDNVIVTIFTAIKNAIIAVFKKICAFFKSIFSKTESEISEGRESVKKTEEKLKNGKSGGGSSSGSGSSSSSSSGTGLQVSRSSGSGSSSSSSSGRAQLSGSGRAQLGTSKSQSDSSSSRSKSQSQISGSERRSIGMKTIDLKGYKYVNITGIAEDAYDFIADDAMESQDVIKRVVSDFTEYVARLDGTSKAGQISAKDTKALRDVFAKITDPKIETLNNAKATIKSFNESLDSTSNENMDKLNYVGNRTIKVVEFNECDPYKVLKQCNSDLDDIEHVKGQFKTVFEKSKDILNNFKSIVDDAEKRAMAAIKQITASQNKSNYNIRTSATSDMASALNKIINSTDSVLVMVNSLVAKVANRQLNLTKGLILRINSEM